MRKALLFILGFVSIQLQAQTFSDDFEAYPSGEYLGKQGNIWTTWQNKPGSTQDVLISSKSAHSGTNSIYFSTNVEGGGPQDVILPFGGVYDIGRFEFTMWVKIESGKAAYFNFQANKTAGELWAMECNVASDGSAIFSSSGGPLLNTNFPMGEWFELSMDIDLSINVWKVMVNNELKGSFNNPVNQIASMDIFPVNNGGPGFESGFFIDDVSYSYTPFDLVGNNLAVVQLAVKKGKLVNTDGVLTATIRNLGQSTVNDLAIKYSYNGKEYSESIKSMGLASGKTFDYVFTNKFTAASGKKEILVTISTTDDILTDNSLSINIEPIVPAEHKMVILEEGTGTWCGWCPRGTVALGEMKDSYGEYFKGIAVHSGDPMEAQFYTEHFVDEYITGFPSGMVNRKDKLGMSPSEVEAAFLADIANTPAASMICGVKYDESTRKLDISITYNLLKTITADWKVGYIIVEDGVTGTTSDYGQANYYSGGARGEMGGWEKKPSTVPASQMVYDHVARAFLPGYKGVAAFKDLETNSGSSQVFNFQYILNSEWDVNNLEFIPVLFNPEGLIDNGAGFTYDEAVKNGFKDGNKVSGIAENNADQTQFTVYPNPATDLATFSFVSPSAQYYTLSIQDLSGRSLETLKIGEVNGIYLSQINISELASGVYFVELQSDNQRLIHKLIVK